MNAIDLLVTMQQKQDEQHDALVKTVTTGFADIKSALSAHTLDDVKAFAAIHERLAPVEATRKTARWVVAAFFVQFLALAGALAAYALGVHP